MQLEIQVEQSASPVQAKDEDMFEFDDETLQPPAPQEVVQQLLQKLDAMLLVVFEALETFFAQNSEPEKIRMLMQFLLDVFENLIMTTHRSRHVQYLFFFVFSKNKRLPDIFLSYLVTLLPFILNLVRKGGITQRLSLPSVPDFGEPGEELDSARVCGCLHRWLYGE